MKVNNFIRSIVIMAILNPITGYFAGVNMPGITRIKNKIEQNVNNITKLTKENFKKFVTKADGYKYTKENILANLLTPKKIFIDEMNSKIKTLVWATDQFVVNKINNKEIKIIEYLNQKACSMHTSSLLSPILLISNDLSEELKVIDQYIIEIQAFMEEEKKVTFKVQFDASNQDLNSYLNKMLELKNNIFVIASYLNSLLTIKS
ncbi:hypothetical protein KJ644_02620 [Candidatus Dependentiae bacterium]|nr:hypothetical protein [Candidatus Dependentiae bacterium]MBU4387342.1 hypothetical protein [Candidatus Dependentiae bacterium]MCG2756193.1 hypothetical protein [Candidatus Dependentiae bacterium]